MGIGVAFVRELQAWSAVFGNRAMQAVRATSELMPAVALGLGSLTAHTTHRVCAEARATMITSMGPAANRVFDAELQTLRYTTVLEDAPSIKARAVHDVGIKEVRGSKAHPANNKSIVRPACMASRSGAEPTHEHVLSKR